LKNGSGVGSHSQDFSAAAGKLFIAITQARQLRATVRSHKTPQEGEHNQLAAKIG
jgi:hypothetical protein